MTGTTPARVRRRLLLHLDADFLSLPFPPSPRRTPLRIKSAEQPEERACIVDAICGARWGDDDTSASATGPFSAVSIPLRALRNTVRSSRIVDLATNCYGYYVLQKVLDCEEDCLLIVSELLRAIGDDADEQACVASYVAPPLIDADFNPSSLSVNKSLKDK
ncbi:hypothetical protein B0H13DRAFT_2346161 [Mycena leptocephala]|nr:hypothetical protein B0H13DRAFT_2346161 [Mycena leptocephala]